MRYPHRHLPDDAEPVPARAMAKNPRDPPGAEIPDGAFRHWLYGLGADAGAHLLRSPSPVVERLIATVSQVMEAEHKV